MIKETDEFLVKTKAVLKLDNNEFALNEWVTLSEYCKRYELKSISVVSNWIVRGIVPKENIIRVREMNNLKLIKAVPYGE